MTITGKSPKVLVTGSSGQLGQELQKLVKELGHTLYLFTTRDDFDITNADQIAKGLDLHKPDIIINTAAYTAVDLAETKKDQAKWINTIGVQQLAKEAAARGIALIHISTDYVFDGRFEDLLTETTKPNPISVYGESKYDGEQAILASGIQRYAIIRTSWLYGAYGSNFVKTMLRLASERSHLAIVNDQIGSPTWTYDLATAIEKITHQLTAANSGIYHYANAGEVSWYAFAKAIFLHAQKDVAITPIPTSEYPTAAERPKRSVLACHKISEVFKIEIPTWEESLQKLLTSRV